ncbi:hypothetical protein [Endozoicomonas sp. 8E]|uniref:hypothetical protein n=1 Tax=Endozoicomonas sp. 8E TaxID=3035692 RepID=UPI002938E248|nr:hypothetical protein [Endozoicomonas sp. 8E]WOG29590.1 hypothetical protein P6910_08040 [Endozoicomonas sp. 8E]
MISTAGKEATYNRPWLPKGLIDSLLRGNDDLRAWEQAVGVLRHPRRRESSANSGLLPYWG